MEVITYIFVDMMNDWLFLWYNLLNLIQFNTIYIYKIHRCNRESHNLNFSWYIDVFVDFILLLLFYICLQYLI